MKNKIIKGITLSFFTTLIIAFVAYKSGYFKNQQPTNNSTIKVDSIKKIQLLSSSKLIVLKDHEMVINDSVKKEMDSMSIESDKIILSSSKSGIIFTQDDLKKMADSIKTNSSKK
ncbi:hypothetical protein [Tenacibaculum sp. M341]|uniref:hypothetical protein n=1 Tax=Tenacibaculum sp. M341 TaxID=2530339 RepID=UPI001053C9EA|nr:hypothetical protein [Tenacibaculum sp. M341]TCI94421.1 hypothetical protein EYW44_03495 [Tenacibaculum sp. M341]